MSRKKIVSFILSVLVSAVLLWLLFSQIDFQDLVEVFSKIYIPGLFAFLGMSLLGSWLRASRYKLLIKPHPIRWDHIFLVTFIRNLFVDLLPIRAGSLSYVYFLNQRLRYPFEVAASSFILSFVFDFLTLSPFLIIAILLAGLGSSVLSISTLIVISVIFLILIGFVLWKILPITSLFIKIYERLIRALNWDQKNWAFTSIQKLVLTRDTLAMSQKKAIYWPVLGLSFLIRLAKYGSLYFLLLAILHSLGFSWSNLSFFKTILGITGAELTSVLPIKGIAGFGTWETAWALTFKLMNYDPQLAIISGIGVHLITNLWEYTLGIISLLIISLPSFRSYRRETI